MQLMANPKNLNGNFLIFLLAFLGPFSTTFLDKINLVVCFFIIFLYFLFSLISSRGAKFSGYSILIVTPIVIVVIIGYISGFLNFDIVGTEYQKYVITSRFFTVISTILFVTCIAIWSERVSSKEHIIFIKVAFASTCLFLIFAIIQQICFVFNLPFMVDSRSDMHGVPQSIRNLFPNRITSIAREPNFYAPILVESLILTRLVFSGLKAYTFYVLTLVVLLLTFSGGAYAHFILLVIFIFLQSLKFNISLVKTFFKFFLILILSYTIAINLFPEFFDNLSQFIYAKSTTESSGASYRSQIIQIIIDSWTSSDLKVLLIGNGIASLSFFDEITGLNTGLDFSITNNLYLDYLWDAGAIGLVILLLFWGIAFSYSYRSRFDSLSKQVNVLLFFSLLITSVYRSEYVTTHHAWLLSLLIVTFKINDKKSPEN
ncbi:hypothetical protein HGO26_07905 [Shewanella sp. S-1]|uniref:O-Antigen ligase n=1 Tax=Shewanella oncorhynchi TaxID=2726434 RepID=A0ABX1KNW3_9GAMM|nr:hypothetical protein [Shewanella oncorhynchi]NLQ22802.1 hypothetical protein [Shewanella oncorhynchi]